MKKITIDHPLRTISYLINENGFPLPHEANSLENYRLAHDQVWRMKRLFEQEKGEAQLTLIRLLKLEDEQRELRYMLNFYKEQVDFSSAPLSPEFDIKFQVELRNFYNSVIQHQQTLVKFYDAIAVCDRAYIEITDTYIRKEKPIDPLNFNILESVFEHSSDMQVDVVSLDGDLQQFLTILTDVYLLLDDYIMQYNTLYKAYSAIVQQAAQLTKDVQVLNVIWGT